MPDLDALLLLTGAATSLRWGLSHRVRGLPDAPAESPFEYVPRDDSLSGLWARRVACRGGALPDTELADVLPIRNGREARIELVPGQQTTKLAMAATERICSALQLAAGSVVVEPTRDGRADHARLLVVDDNPMHVARQWPGPTLSVDSGVADAGIHADEEVGRVRWFTPGSGAANMLFAGSQGTGKSRGLDWMLTESWHATYPHPETGVAVPWVHSWIADGQHGNSLPDWLEIAPWAATETSETLLMLRAAKRIMDWRSRDFSRFRWVDDKGRERRGLKHFDPVLTGRPLLQIVIDECHSPLAESREIVELSIDIARKGRKCGVRLVYATQIPSVKNLGDNVDLRSLLSVNVLCYRTQDRLSGAMALPGSDLDPGTLPREFPDGTSTAGLAYLLGPGSRPAPLRTWLVDDPFDLCVDLPVAELHPNDVKAAGEDFASWRRRRDEALDREDDEREETSEPTPLPTPPPLEQTAPEPPETAEPLGVPSVREMVLDAVHAGHRSTGKVVVAVQGRAAELGVSRNPKTVGDALAELVADGVVLRLGRGRYALPGEEAAA